MSERRSWGRWRRVFVVVHLWLGLVAGLYISVVSVTGAALVFRIHLQRAWHPHLFTPSAAGPLAAPEVVLDGVQRAYPLDRVAGVDAPTTARPTYLAYVIRGPRFLTVLIDPVTATVLGEVPEQSFVRTIQDLHFDLLAGETGRLVNGIGAGCLLAMCATGVVIWWPTRGRWRRGFTIDLRGSWRRALWDLHRVTGIATVLFLSMWAVTGLYFVFPASFRATVNAISPITVVRPPSSGEPAAAGTPRPSWDALISRAREQRPREYVARVVVPGQAKAPFHVLFSTASPTPVGSTLTSVYLDQYTGAVLPGATPSRTTGDAIIAWLVTLHVGSFESLTLKIVWLIVGLIPPLLFVSGFVLWWARVVRPRLARSTP